MVNITDKQPTNLNQLNVVSFDLSLSRLPKVEYFCQRINIPSVTLGETKFPTPFIDLPVEGDTLVYDVLSIGFILDEDLQNYIELYTWMTALGFPKEYPQFTELKEPGLASETTGKYSDMTIILHTNKANPNYQVTFTDVFPTSLGGVQFDSTPTGMDPIVVDASFMFRGMFNIDKIV